MAEKTPNQQLAEKLLFKPAYVGDKSAAVKQEAHTFAEGYKKFLDAGKTEREVAAESEQMLKDAGYQQFDPKKTYAPGDKVYFSQLGKAIVASTIGTRSFEDGFRLVIAHTDSPRLDLRPTPLYESDHLSYFKTHYYGGIRKYQWGTMPLAIHGVFSRADGTTVSVNVGEDENDPVFCITDLLPHLSAEQSERKLSDGIRAEELNILIGSDAVDDKEVKEAVKLNTMILLNEKYGITEKDFARAEIEIVPAYKSRDVGFDRSMIGGYGHDDRVDAYPALMAEIATKNPAFTTVCVLTDRLRRRHRYAEHVRLPLHAGALPHRRSGRHHCLPQQCLPVRRRHRCLRPELGQRFRADERHLRRPRHRAVQVHRQPRQERCKRRFCRAGGLCHPHDGRRQRCMADR